VAALELGKRRNSEEVRNGEKILLSKHIYNYFHPLLCDLSYEEFWVLFLNRASKVIDRLKISQGGVATTIVDEKIIYKEAVLRLATSVVLCHNHPSGNPIPSSDDDNVTVRLQRGLKFLDMDLRDHVIICDGNFYSYADENRI
jgi:DNA repair protein RadC